jgi:LysM repeat protein
MRTKIFLALWLLASACTLTAGQPEIEITPVGSVPTPTAVIIVATEEPDSNTPTATPPVTTSCTPRADWTITYFVVTGDTMASIARRTNSTVSALAAGNCILNPDNIVVGQALRVPRVPSSQLPPTVPPIGMTQNYTNPTLGIALEYPVGWTVQEGIGYVDFGAPDGSIIEITYSPAGQMIDAEKAFNDCVSAFACIGNSILLSQQSITLASGFTGVRGAFSADQVDGSPGPWVLFSVAMSNRNLYIRSFGDLGFFDPVILTLRPLMF